jgi:aryl-phospho-beta-D-glucosidase BglC (GH1 family)
LLVKRCHERGIGTLIDFHALPGGANPGDHSGTNSGKAEFWGSKENKALATRCLCFIAHQAEKLEGLVGIQIVNESETNAPGMYEWYDSVLAEFSKIDASIPVYVSDAWDFEKAVGWSLKKNTAQTRGSPAVIDTHLYWCFTDNDGRKSPQQITGEVWSKLSELDGKEGKVLDHGAVQVSYSPI